MKAIIYFNFIISVLFTLCYAYQFFYVLVGLFLKPKKFEAKCNHKYAIVISARNESAVIGNLIRSIKTQKYPSELIDIFVIADNCTDDTAKVSRREGAKVYERFNEEQIGKGYALNWFFDRLKEDNKEDDYEAFMIFDADNVLDSNFVSEMNKVFDNGYRIITSYRNSKNYDSNWISAGYSLWFLREAKYLNHARMRIGTSCAISGTGFLVSTDVFKENGGWIHHLLTEDIEFTTDSIIKGEKIGYCDSAILYDEQPHIFKQSYIQRLRWAKGFYQVFRGYGARLIKGVFKGNFSCYDMLMTLMPAMLLTLSCVVVNVVAISVGLIRQSPEMGELMEVLVQTFLSFYCVFFALGAVTTVTERRQIHCDGLKKFKYLFTFPIFMMTYVPISIIALFKKVEWSPITHSLSKTVSDIRNKDTVIK